MYIKIKELADIESRLIKSGFAKQESFTWSGDLGYKELKCYPTNKVLGDYISFRWYDRNGDFEICFGYDSRLGAWGDFRYKADITHIISTIGIGNWVKVVKDMATDKAPNIVFK